jgi:sterol desaturase/sphingolipid hydroxylase (fatty acid hydroxylase superfamily)
MNISSKIRFPKRFEQSVWRFVVGIVVAFLFFVAFMFSYALPASAPTVPWQFYSIAGIFAITGLILAILAFDKELYWRK